MKMAKIRFLEQGENARLTKGAKLLPKAVQKKYIETCRPCRLTAERDVLTAILQTDAETGRIITLANTSFKLKDADGEYVKQMVYYPREEEIDTFTTDETGCVTLPETVTWGLYFIEEVESPEGYLIRSEDFAVFVGREGDTPDTVYELDIEIPNDPVKGQLRLEKKGLQLTGFEPMTDAYGNEYQKPIFELRYLAGAVFEVRAAEDIVGRDGTVWFEKDTLVDTITTTEAGGDMSKVLPLGKYIVTEVETPAGYVCDPKEYEAELVFADNQTAMVETTVEIENAYLPAEITLHKEKKSFRRSRRERKSGRSLRRLPARALCSACIPIRISGTAPAR